MTDDSDLDAAYRLKTPEDSVRLYRDWSGSYDADFAQAQGYRLPAAVAEGFADAGGTGPLLLNGVQHVVHPPQHLDAWPDDDHRSRLVVIARGIEENAVRASLVAFDGTARRS